VKNKLQIKVKLPTIDNKLSITNNGGNMSKNTRNVTFPVEQGMYDRLQAFKKAPGLGVAARRALQYLLDHPNEVLNPKQAVQAPQQAAPVEARNQTINRVYLAFKAGKERAGYPELTEADQDRLKAYYRTKVSPPVSHEVLYDAWLKIKADYPEFLQQRKRKEREARMRQWELEASPEYKRAKELQEKAAERAILDAMKPKVLEAIRSSKDPQGIASSTVIGIVGEHNHGDYHRIEAVIDELTAANLIKPTGSYRTWFAVPSSEDLEKVLEVMDYSGDTPARIAEKVQLPLVLVKSAIDALVEDRRVKESPYYEDTHYSKR
jgi:hypothetical protein